MQALATLGRIIALPIEAGALCDDLAKAYAGTDAADTQSLDEKDEGAALTVVVHTDCQQLT